MKLNPNLLMPALAGWLAVSAPAQEPKRPATLAELQTRLAEHVAQPRFAAALWGVKIVALDSGKTVFEHNPQKLFSPASNSKLYTVALALDRLGADYRVKTSLYAKTLPDKNGVLEGDLIVYGRGDPTINARLHTGDIYKALEPLVQALTNTGVKSINGDLVGDQSFIHGPEFGSGWDWADLENYYGAEISALTINDNALQVSVKPGDNIGAPCKLTVSPATDCLTFSNRTITVTKGTHRSISFYRPVAGNVVYATGQIAGGDPAYTEDVTFHNPAAVFIAFFKEALARQGIRVSGKLRTVNWLDRQVEPLEIKKLVELGSVESLPMRDIAREVMKPSQNLYTDLLLAHVGERRRTAELPARRTSEELGVAELQNFLAEAGVKRGDVLFEEGSGLSRNNLTTPNATIALLQYMNRHKCADAYLEALPIAGVDGTLKSRMKGTAAQGNLRAKTGTLRWANSLSGYVTTAAGERLLFSIMLNRYHSTDPNRTAPIDAIAVLLAGFTGKTSEP
jgi:D-alanyl-D-alanine carboxypeptidase/D-alanyl-D-alanine-endopeptidase (penicillin-binding protein 4)